MIWHECIHYHEPEFYRLDLFKGITGKKNFVLFGNIGKIVHIWYEKSYKDAMHSYWSVWPQNRRQANLTKIEKLELIVQEKLFISIWVKEKTFTTAITEKKKQITELVKYKFD